MQNVKVGNFPIQKRPSLNRSKAVKRGLGNCRLMETTCPGGRVGHSRRQLKPHAPPKGVPRRGRIGAVGGKMGGGGGGINPPRCGVDPLTPPEPPGGPAGHRSTSSLSLLGSGCQGGLLEGGWVTKLSCAQRGYHRCDRLDEEIAMAPTSSPTARRLTEISPLEDGRGGSARLESRKNQIELRSTGVPPF